MRSFGSACKYELNGKPSTKVKHDDLYTFVLFSMSFVTECSQKWSEAEAEV